MTRLPILVVEDNAATRKMMRLALQAEGHAVLEAEDGATALRMVKQNALALVLLDCKLPDADGFELARRLHDLAPGLAILAVTGWAQADESRARAAGFLDILLKPVEPSRLVEVVDRHLGRASDGTLRAATAGKLVILADDDATQRKLARLALTHAGFEVVEAADGEAALRMARARKPDAIVSDVLMPTMDGFAVCQAVRGDPRLADVPLVLVSAHYLEEEDRALGKRFGASRYVSRSDGLDVVVHAVMSALDAPRAAPTDATREDLREQHVRRIARQLERQASIGSGLARRVALQATALSILDSLADSLSRQLDPESALGDTLAGCLDAAGLSVGAILLRGEDGRLQVKAHVGAPLGDAWAAHEDVLLRAVAGAGIQLPSAEAGPAGDSLLGAMGVASALVVPLVARDEALGVLLLASNEAVLTGAEGSAFVRAARSLSMQFGQALALGRTFAKLASTEQRYRALLENAPDAISVTTLDGVIIEANRGCETMLGVPRSDMLGRNIADFMPAESRAAETTEHERARAQRGVPVGSLRRRPDGSVVNVEVSRTVVDIGGERFVLSVGRDVTQRIALEEQLRQAQKMEAVGRLAGGVAHDFNNLLSVILSYGEVLLSEMRPDEPMRADVEEIQKAGQRATELTRQLLMFSRQQVLAPRVLDLNDVLSSMDKMLRRILGADVDLVSLPAPRLGRVRADQSSVEQIVMNLAVNARDAMPRGGKLTMETANVDLDDAYTHAHLGAKPGPHVMLAVTDNGTGIEKATLARIFEPFFTTKESGKGTGLGLSTVFGAMQQSGGSVWVYSEVGVGTTFKVYFPRVDAPLAPLGASLAPTTRRGTETILLVEDDDQVRTVAVSILRRSGYVVIEARNAGEALLHSEQHASTIHLLLSDVVMPQMSGPELARRLTAVRPGMKVLCMSGYTDDSIIRHGVLEARIAFLQKPITLETLTAKVREVLDGPPSAPSCLA